MTTTLRRQIEVSEQSLSDFLLNRCFENNAGLVISRRVRTSLLLCYDRTQGSVATEGTCNNVHVLCTLSCLSVHNHCHILFHVTPFRRDYVHDWSCPFLKSFIFVYLAADATSAASSVPLSVEDKTPVATTDTATELTSAPQPDEDKTPVVPTNEPQSELQPAEEKTDKLITNDLETTWALLAENFSMKPEASSPKRRY